MKRILSLFLCVLMLGGMLVSCKKDQPTDEQTTAPVGDTVPIVADTVEATETETQWETDENGFVKDKITEDMTYDGKEIKILGWKEAKNTTMPDAANDANNALLQKLYYHRLMVEARLDVVFNIEYVNAAWTAADEFFTKVRSPEASYDLIQTYSLWPMVMAQEGLLKNLNKLAYPTLEMPWWPDSTTEWSQYDSLYFVAGNSSVEMIQSMEVVFCNTEMLTAEGLTDPVELFLDGKWTIDTMLQYAKQFRGLAEADPGSVYGLTVSSEVWMDCLYYGSGFSSTKNNAEGVAELAFDDTTTLERIDGLLDKLVEGFKGAEVELPTGAAPLNREKTAMHIGPLSEIFSVSNTDTYAVISAPKLDEDQEKYRVINNNGYDVWSVPLASTDPELAGVVIEAVVSSEYRNIAPYFYENNLKKRYSSDAMGMQAFDLIRSSVIYDFGRAGQRSMGVILETTWRNNFYELVDNQAIKSPKNIFTGEIETKLDMAKIKLEQVLQDYRAYRDN